MDTHDAGRREALEPVFPENLQRIGPAVGGSSAPLPSPWMLVDIPLTPRPNPPRVLIADDDANALEAWVRSARAKYSGALDLRVWQPGRIGLLDQVREWAGQGWHPDVVVIDLNFDDGGKHGVHYVEELRREPGYAALPIALATANQHSDLERGELSIGTNLTSESPVAWLQRLKPLEPEAILYGKTGDARFLGRVGQGLTEWTRVARRRAWVKLLGQVAMQLDDVSVDVDHVARVIVDFAHAELAVDHAVVRQRVADGRYRRLAGRSSMPPAAIVDLLHLDDVPVLRRLLDETRPLREPVLEDELSAADAGRFSAMAAGMRLLGVDAVLGRRPVGYIALLRTPDKPPFDREVDATYLTILARLLASAIRVSLLRERQTRLLLFANDASKATRRRHVGEHLAAILHEELHHDDDDCKVTVRLLNFGTGEFQRRADKGRLTNAPEVVTPGDSAYALYADVVRSNQSVLDTLGSTVLEHASGIAASMCVPLSVGDFAMGVVVLEHTSPQHYRPHDIGFVRAAAALAASALERLRVERLLGDMTDFVLRFTRDTAAELDVRLRNLLHEFSGNCALVDLEADEDPQAPWHIRHVDLRAPAMDKEALVHQMERIYATRWRETFLGRLTARQQWRDSWAEFTTDASTFYSLPMLADGNGRQTADAVLWIRHGDAPPHRALLLMWSFPPPMGESDVNLLGTMARVFSELSARRVAADELMQRTLIGEQAAQIGHVMQHFRHRMNSLNGAIASNIDLMHRAHRGRDEATFDRAWARARDLTQGAGSAFHKASAYIKQVEFEPCNLRSTVMAAIEGLEDRLRTVTLEINVPETLAVDTDAVVASLVVYSLLENALDAVRAEPKPCITVAAQRIDGFVRLRVEDNGHGISPKFRENLFEWGATTKREGLGSALAYGRARARALRGELALSGAQPTRGAAFELDLPLDAGDVPRPASGPKAGDGTARSNA